MTRPIYEPSLTRTDAELGYGKDQLFRRPAPVNALGFAWIEIANGATTAPAAGTDIPLPFEELSYDPALVVQGDIFDWETTDEGDVGNTRFQLKCVREGWYLYDLVSQWGQITSNGTEDFGYALMEARPNNPGETDVIEDIRSSMDWMNDTVGTGTCVGVSCNPGEQRRNPFLSSSGMIYCSGNNRWKPRCRQTTGSDRDLSGVHLRLFYIQPTDNADWVILSIPPSS